MRLLFYRMSERLLTNDHRVQRTRGIFEVDKDQFERVSSRCELPGVIPAFLGCIFRQLLIKGTHLHAIHIDHHFAIVWTTPVHNAEGFSGETDGRGRVFLGCQFKCAVISVLFALILPTSGVDKSAVPVVVNGF